MHRDLKPENILLKRTDSHTDIRVVDYGLAVFLLLGQKLSNMAGSAYYIAPEVLGGSYSQEGDMWSLGVVLYIMLCGLPPFWQETEDGIFRAIRIGSFDLDGGPWRRISIGAKSLVTSLLRQNPARRLTPEQAIGTLSALFNKPK